MFKKVSPYIGEYKKYTVWAVIMMSVGIIASIAPYFCLYQIIAPITRKEHIDMSFILARVVAVLVCEVIYAIAYVKGLTYSHISAYNTLKNLGISLQGKLEKQSLGNIHSLGTGRIKKIFTDDIARCILKDSPIVILDEATASVDADNERAIQDAISELCKDKTLLVIAHRLNTIENADKIMVVENGNIKESGNHTSLMNKKGVYYSMVTRRTADIT